MILYAHKVRQKDRYKHIHLYKMPFVFKYVLCHKHLHGWVHIFQYNEKICIAKIRILEWFSRTTTPSFALQVIIYKYLRCSVNL